MTGQRFSMSSPLSRKPLLPDQTNGTERDHWTTLDADLRRISRVEYAASYAARPLVATGLALTFILVAAIGAVIAFGQDTTSLVIPFAAAFGAYLAMNIGANDVANNMGPAVGAKSLSMGWAILIAITFECSGAFLSGGDVIKTISKQIIIPQSGTDPQLFVWAMMASLVSSALWINLSTWIGAPVSTTHAVVGGVMGAGIAAAGFSVINWSVLATIAISWVLAPLISACVAAAFLALIKTRITSKEDKIAAARYWVPVLIAIMTGVFATYLSMKGLNRIIHIKPNLAALIGIGIGLLSYFLVHPVIQRQSEGMENRNKSIKMLFNGPLILSAALLSFAHGANDVANAVGPLAAIVYTISFQEIADQIIVPFWVITIGALGISLGLCLFGPKLIRMVGSQITKLNPMRAYCVSLSAAITVIVASWLGMPVSTTHVVVGGVFGVGFFREWNVQRQRAKSRANMPGTIIAREERHRRKLVRRSHFLTIMVAWIVTVPMAALLSGVVFKLLTTVLISS